MSIDARVRAVTRRDDTSGDLALMDRPAEGDGTPGIKGQARLSFDSSPAWVDDLVGKNIWGGANSIMYGEQEIAVREGYTRIRFTAETLHGLGPKASRTTRTA